MVRTGLPLTLALAEQPASNAESVIGGACGHGRRATGMKAFAGYLQALKRVDSKAGYRPVDQYFFRNQKRCAELADALNQELAIDDDPLRCFQRDVPLIGVGAWRGIVLLSANPGYRDPKVDPRNAREDEYRRHSMEQCTRFTGDFFQVQRDVLGKRLRFWARTINLLELLGWDRVRRAAGQSGNDKPRSTEDRWGLAHHSRLLGGWELLPWHSEKDGFSSRLTGSRANSLLRKLCDASLSAVLRAKPEVLVVASAAGYDLARASLKRASWQESVAPSSRAGRGTPVPVACCVVKGVRVVAVRAQMFSSYTPLHTATLIETVGALR